MLLVVKNLTGELKQHVFSEAYLGVILPPSGQHKPFVQLLHQNKMVPHVRMHCGQTAQINKVSLLTPSYLSPSQHAESAPESKDMCILLKGTPAHM